MYVLEWFDSSTYFLISEKKNQMSVYLNIMQSTMDWSFVVHICDIKLNWLVT